MNLLRAQQKKKWFKFYLKIIFTKFLLFKQYIIEKKLN
jgi:hypothetical protein